MASLSVTNTFATGTKIFASQVNQNYSDIVNYINNRNSASSAWDSLSVSGNAVITGGLTVGVNQTITGILQVGNGSASTPAFSFSAATTYGMFYNGSNQLTIQSNGASGAYLSLFSNGDIVNNQISPLATTATAGFSNHIPTMAGTPTGVPSSYTGQKPMIYDTSANKIWVYNGSWRGVVVS